MGKRQLQIRAVELQSEHEAEFPIFFLLRTLKFFAVPALCVAIGVAGWHRLNDSRRAFWILITVVACNLSVILWRLDYVKWKQERELGRCRRHRRMATLPPPRKPEDAAGLSDDQKLQN